MLGDGLQMATECGHITRVISFSFDEVKATQAAAHLTALEGGNINYMKLIKLLYLADRNAITQRGNPIVGGHYVSMKNGPVLSRVLDIIKPGGVVAAYWKQHIDEAHNYHVRLKGPPPTGDLSEREIEWLDKVYSVYGSLDEWQLVEFTHLLPEWKDPGKSVLPIRVEKILESAKASQEEISAIEAETGAANRMSEILKD